MQWFTGKVLRFSTIDQREYFVHENLLNAKCAATAFHFETIGNTRYHATHISDTDFDGFPHFLLWLNCGTMGPLGEEPEKSYLAAFRFAHSYGLHEFENFVSSKFAEFAPLHYGDDAHNPSLSNLVYAHEHLDDQTVCMFITEQFVRSYIFRHAYLEMQLDWLIDNYPRIAKVLFKAVQDLVRQSRRKSLATFEWSNPNTPAEYTDEYDNESTYLDQPNRSDNENQQIDNSQESSGDSPSTSSTEDFEVVTEEPRGEEPPSESALAEEPGECESSAAEYEATKPADAVPGPEPGNVKDLLQESVDCGMWAAEPSKVKKKYAWGLGVSEPTVEDVPENVASEPLMDAVARPTMAAAENIVPPKKSKKNGKGSRKKAKVAKAARAAVESQV